MTLDSGVGGTGENELSGAEASDPVSVQTIDGRKDYLVTAEFFDSLIERLDRVEKLAEGISKCRHDFIEGHGPDLDSPTIFCTKCGESRRLGVEKDKI